MKLNSVNLKDLFFSTLGGFQYGYSTAIIAGALSFISALFSLDPTQEGILVSIILFSATLTCASAGILANKIGRRWTLLLSSCLFLIGTIIATLAGRFETLLIGRFITGLGGGLAATVVPIYCAEIAPIKKRGAIVHCNQIAIALGFVCAYLCSYLFSFSGNWRAMFGVGILFASLQCIGLFFINESLPQLVKGTSLKHLFNKIYRSRIVIAVALAIFQQLTGVTAVLYYAPFIFKKAGFTVIEQAILATVIIGIINLLGILVSFWCIDKAGRRFLLLTSFIGIISSLSLMATTLFLQLSDTLALICMMVFLAFYSVGIGPITSLVAAEIFPTKMRGHAMTLSGTIGWFFTFLVALVFTDLNDLLSMGGTFLLLAFFSFLALLFVFKKVPETKNRSFEALDKMFKEKL